MTERKKFEDNQPGMDQKIDVPNEDLEQTKHAAESGEQGRASYTAGSTTQGGSNHGQGSLQLGGESHHQGEQKNAGSNYDNEAERFGKNKPDNKQHSKKGQMSEARDDIPHGQGAHVNEKESNAQEDYPGTGPTTGKENEPEKDII